MSGEAAPRPAAPRSIAPGLGRPMAFRLGGLSCPDCAAALERRVAALPGVTAARVDFGTARLVVEGEVAPALVVREAEREGVAARMERRAEGRTEGWAEGWAETTHRRALRAGIAAAALLVGSLGGVLGLPGQAVTGLYALAILAGGYHTIRRGLAALRRFSPDMNALMTVAVLGAVAIGQWWEAATVAFLYAVSNALESYSAERARAAIRSLVAMAPKEASVRRDGREVRIPVEEVAVGDLLLVRPGERVAMDGLVVAGASAVDQSPITGESAPVDKGPGDGVFAGSINRHGFLEVEVTRAAGDNTLARIIHLVEEAQARRAPVQGFVDRFARAYTPAALAAAFTLALLPPLFFGQPWGPWVYRALALVVVACPCALVVSTPVTVVTALGNAARHGVLIEGGAFLEEAGRLAIVAFDKTGTLTLGRPAVTRVVPLDGVTEGEVLALAAAVEGRSEHPLAAAVVRRAAALGLAVPEAGGFASIPGKGVRAEVGGRLHYVGSARWFDEMGVDAAAAGREAAALAEEGHTVVLVGGGGRVLGLVAVADEVRPGAAETVAALARLGVSAAVLSGDNEAAVRAVARRLGIGDYRAGLLPEEKLAVVRELRERHGRVAMVGDGVNDAPALAAATVGVAMGVAGTDTALETADVALMSDDLSRLPFVIGLSRAALRTIRQNVAFSLALKALAVAAVFPGWLTLWLAILGDMGATLLVTANALRLLRVRPDV